MMNPENLKKIESDIEKVLKEAGVSPNQADELRRKLLKLQKEKDRKLLASDIAEVLAEKLKISPNNNVVGLLDQKRLIEAIKEIKIEPKITVEPPIVNVKPADPKVIVKREVPRVIVKPPKIEIKGQEAKFPKQITVAGFSNFVKSIGEFMKERWTRKKPMPVTLVHKGETYKAIVVGGGGGPSRVYLRNDRGQTISPATEDSIAELPLASSTPYVYNVLMDGADTEYSQLLPDGTKKFKVYAIDVPKRRPHRDALKVSYESGGTPFVIPAGNYHEEFNVKLTSKTLYFQSPTGSAYVVIVSWI